MATRKTSVESPPAPCGETESGAHDMEETAWRLPSGQDLISFALATGFAVQPLLDGRAAVDREKETEFDTAEVRRTDARKEV